MWGQNWTPPTAGNNSGAQFNPNPFSTSNSSSSCAPVKIYDQFGILITEIPSGGSYTVNPDSSYTLTFTMPVAAQLYRAFVQPFNGTLILTALPSNMTSFDLRIVNGTTSTPYTQADLPLSLTVTKRDIISFECVPTNAALPVTTAFTIYYSADSASITTDVLGGNGRYLTTLNQFDQTASVIDVTQGGSGVGGVIITRALTAAKDFRSGDFRTNNQGGYFFGTNWYNYIDLNPASGTFGDLITAATTSTGTNMVACCYAPPFDVFILGGIGTGQTYRFIPGTGVSSNIGTWLGPSATNGTTRLSYIPSLRAFASYSETVVLLRIVNIDDSFVMNVASVDPGTVREFRGRLYAGCTTQFKVLSLNPLLKQIATPTSLSVLRGGVCFVPSLNRVYFTDYTEKKICVVNCANNTVLGTISGWPGVGDGCRDIQYCPYNGLLYAQSSSSTGLAGINRIYVFDPNSGPIGAYVDFITVGNMYSGSDVYANQMFFNSPQQ